MRHRIKGRRATARRAHRPRLDTAVRETEDRAKLSFSGHQTFPFRYAWIPKGVALASSNAHLFLEDRGMVDLGVGKNMVSSIRYWCETLGLISVDGRTGNGAVSELGRLLFGPKGLDPYLEDPGTLWFLQWQLVRDRSRASTWHLAFTAWNRTVFRREDLVSWLLALASQTGDKRTSEASLRRDVEVFVRTYVPSPPDARRPLEDSFDCPLAELGLIQPVGDDFYEFNRGEQPTLPVEILAYALGCFWAARAGTQETLSFERILYGPGSPGGAFQLSDQGLTRLLERLPVSSGMHYDESAGLRRVVRDQRLGAERMRSLVEGYYGRGKGCSRG